VNDESKTTMSPRRLAQVIRREWWVVALVIGLSMGAALIATVLQQEKYRAKMTLVVGLAGGDFQPEIGSPTLTQTITTLFESEVVASEVIDNLNLDTTPEKLGKKLRVAVRPNSSVLEVTVDSNSTTESERILAEFGTVFRSQIKRLGIQTDDPALGRTSKQALVFATVFNPPRADPVPVSPRRGRALLTAFLVGLIVGLVLAFVRERLDDRIHTREEAEDAFGAPVIGGLPTGARGASPDIASAPVRSQSRRRRDAALDEAMQLLSLNLEIIDEGKGATILVTSTQQEEGKSTLVANLAVALARSGSDVVCVEADPVQPSLRSYLGVDASRRNGKPVSDKSLEELLRGVDVTGGHMAAPAGELRVMSFEDWQQVLAAHGRRDRSALTKVLRERADYVLFDASPLTMGDASRLATLVDNVVVVARAGRTTHSRAETVRAILRRLGVERVSVVLTEAAADDLG
jgi:capsular polysaccharide biosynthesis protein/Mrp family chromosome partitioning ATPase